LTLWKRRGSRQSEKNIRNGQRSNIQSTYTEGQVVAGGERLRESVL